jgi:hypothetical protein
MQRRTQAQAAFRLLQLAVYRQVDLTTDSVTDLVRSSCMQKGSMRDDCARCSHAFSACCHMHLQPKGLISAYHHAIVAVRSTTSCTTVVSSWVRADVLCRRQQQQQQLGYVNAHLTYVQLSEAHVHACRVS